VAGVTFDERVRALEPLGLTLRQARFLVTVALHGGYCVRRQYAAFAGAGYGKNVRDFLDGLVVRGIARRSTFRADRGHVYHVHDKAIYRALEQEDNRNRRVASAALIARKLMVLDYVVSQPHAEWIATEADKVALFTRRFAVDEDDLPCRIYEAASADDGRTARYFIHKLPIYLTGDPAVPHFVYLAADGSAESFEHFLRDHRRLLARLPAWAVVCVQSGHQRAEARLAGAFDRFIAGADGAVDAEPLRRYFAARRLVDGQQLSTLSVSDLNEYRAARRRYAGAAIERLYHAWVADGDQVLADAMVSRPVGDGRLLMRTLAHPYEQFGSMAGVA
jgi:hypothetical protein